VIPVAALLANDTDADLDKGEVLTVTGVGAAVGGAAALDGANVLFTPAADFNDRASFTYTVSDGNDGVATSTAHFDVTPVNVAPVVAQEFTDQITGGVPQTIPLPVPYVSKYSTTNTEIGTIKKDTYRQVSLSKQQISCVFKPQYELSYAIALTASYASSKPHPTNSGELFW
jgi:hypothetical protein